MLVTYYSGQNRGKVSQILLFLKTRCFTKMFKDIHNTAVLWLHFSSDFFLDPDMRIFQFSAREYQLLILSCFQWLSFFFSLYDIFITFTFFCFTKKTGVFFIHKFNNRFKASPVKLLKSKGLHFLTETTLLACVFIPKRCWFL